MSYFHPQISQLKYGKIFKKDKIKGIDLVKKGEILLKLIVENDYLKRTFLIVME